jgi:hypothetical protein
MTEVPQQKVVTWALGPEALEDLFKAKHGVEDSAEMIAVTVDPTTGFILCMFEVSPNSFDSLKVHSTDEEVFMNAEEIYN